MGMMKGNKRTISFKDQEHEMFYRNFLQNCKSGDAYHKALAYCIGINGDTRRNVERIYDFEEDFIKTECLREDWITSSVQGWYAWRSIFSATVRPACMPLKGKKR